MSSLLIQNSKKEKADQKPFPQSGNVQTAHDLEMHIKGCGLNNRDSQKEIYRSFYSYAMAVCVRYADNRDSTSPCVIVHQIILLLLTYLVFYTRQDLLLKHCFVT